MHDADRDIAVNRARSTFASLGYRLVSPDDISEMSSTGLWSIASDISTILGQVYRRDPALHDERARRMIDSFAAGDLLPFVLVDGDGRVVITTSFTRIPARSRTDNPTTAAYCGEP